MWDFIILSSQIPPKLDTYQEFPFDY